MQQAQLRAPSPARRRQQGPCALISAWPRAQRAQRADWLLTLGPQLALIQPPATRHSPPHLWPANLHHLTGASPAPTPRAGERRRWAGRLSDVAENAKIIKRL